MPSGGGGGGHDQAFRFQQGIRAALAHDAQEQQRQRRQRLHEQEQEHRWQQRRRSGAPVRADADEYLHRLRYELRRLLRIGDRRKPSVVGPAAKRDLGPLWAVGYNHGNPGALL